MIKKILPYLIMTLALIPLIFLILRPGFWVSDDGGWMVIRLSAFHQTIRSGQFPVRFLYPLNHGYGYPVLDFLYPLPFYLGEAVHLIGFGFVDSVKVLFIASFVLGAAFMYRYAGLAAALVYSFLPYRLFGVFTRGSLGEAVAFIFPPLIFWAIDKKKFILASLATAALITSHNVIAFIFLPILFAYSLMKIWVPSKSKKNLVLTASPYLLAACLSAWFWLPAIYDLQFTRAGQVAVSNFADYFLNLSNFWQVLGPTIPLILLFSVFRRKTFFFFVVALVAVFLALPVSAPLWAVLPLPRLVQFPWRFLALAVFCIAVMTSSLNRWLGTVMVLITILLSLPFLKTDRTFQPDSYYATNDATTTVKNEYMPKWVKIDPLSRPEEGQAVYFPGVKVVVNGRQVEPGFDANGIITTKGKIIFQETPIRLFADFISLGGLVVSVLLWQKRLRFL